MAYLLYKHIKNKRAKKAAALTEPEQSVPDTPGGTETSPEQSQAFVDRNQIHGQDNTNNRTPVVEAEEAERIKAEASRRRKYRWKMVAGLILPNFLASVDTTIVAPAVPIISSHFNHLSGGFNWIVTAYTLTVTTFVPISGQIADVYGRHTALQSHIFCLMIGSVFCAAAQTWGMLLFGRGLQGIGAAGIQNLTRVVLSDNVDLAENAKNNTIFSLIAGISYAVGPVIGGYLAAADWRYCFVISIPIAFISHFLIFFLMRKELIRGWIDTGSNKKGYISALATFDFMGMFLFIFGVGLIILAVMWAGTQYAWNSAAVIAPLVLGGILFVSFFLHEYLLEPGRLSSSVFPKQVAMIPWSLFQKHDTFLLTVINFATGASLYSAFYFISIYWEVAEGYAASEAGVQLLYYTPGLGVGAYSAMALCNLWPRQTFYPLFIGSVVEATGFGLITWAISIRHKALVNGMLALAGAGTGLRFMPVVLHAAGIWRTRLASVMSLLSFTISFGGTIAISMMGSVFTNKLDKYIVQIAPAAGQQGFNPNALKNLTTISDLPANVQERVREAGARAVMWAFVSVLPFMACSVVAAALLGNVWIGRGKLKESDENSKGAVLYGVYPLALLKGNIKQQKQPLDEFNDTKEKPKKSPEPNFQKGEKASNKV
ncbi:MFS general substrate transporter [Glonium stellatum]|uniref:MFS general substrate transporter n=1 Tax=Glonium stellatum TaxID=574774 RepID=A0A8E2F818_9PEZI|nr:MFS general substrate transporter [Glonium stellatum]